MNGDRAFDGDLALLISRAIHHPFRDLGAADRSRRAMIRYLASDDALEVPSRPHACASLRSAAVPLGFMRISTLSDPSELEEIGCRIAEATVC